MILLHTLKRSWDQDPYKDEVVEHRCTTQCINLRGKKWTYNVQTKEVEIDD